MTEWCACLTPPLPPPPKMSTLTFYVFICHLVKNLSYYQQNLMPKNNFMPKLLLDGCFQHDIKLVYYLKGVHKSLVWVSPLVLVLLYKCIHV